VYIFEFTTGQKHYDEYTESPKITTIDNFAQMSVYEYLLKFRKVNSPESLEKLFDHLNYSLTDDHDIINMYRAADHRRAELAAGGKLFDIGQVPKSVWHFVV
jgi:hypothetical protein